MSVIRNGSSPESKPKTIKQNNIIYGSFGRRFVALLLDTLIVGVPLMLLLGLGSLVFANNSFLQYTLGEIGLVIFWLYDSLMVSSSHQATLGKMLMGLKVTNLNYERLTWAEASLRYMCSYISAFALWIGYLMVLFDQRRRSLHDRLAGTYVIYDG